MSFVFMDVVLFFLPASVAKHVAHTLGFGKVMGSMLGPKCVIAKDINS